MTILLSAYNGERATGVDRSAEGCVDEGGCARRWVE